MTGVKNEKISPGWVNCCVNRMFFRCIGLWCTWALAMNYMVFSEFKIRYIDEKASVIFLSKNKKNWPNVAHFNNFSLLHFYYFLLKYCPYLNEKDLAHVYHIVYPDLGLFKIHSVSQLSNTFLFKCVTDQTNCKKHRRNGLVQWSQDSTNISFFQSDICYWRRIHCKADHWKRFQTDCGPAL